jgi:ferredoxin, 2Fe-2S|tara:strand:- start:364 stop:684 length:321 start_codon:yes stop_codon:yes gene_type:complete
MPLIHYIESNGDEYEAEVALGDSVMQGAVGAMIDGILAECGGKCRCGTCHCYVDEDWMDKAGEVSDAEKIMLEMVVDPQANSRLSCQIIATKALDGLVIRLPKSQY